MECCRLCSTDEACESVRRFVFLVFEFRNQHFPRPRPPNVNCTVANDAGQPSARIAPFSIEARGILPDPHEGVVHRIRCQIWVDCDPDS